MLPVKKTGSDPFPAELSRGKPEKGPALKKISKNAGDISIPHLQFSIH